MDVYVVLVTAPNAAEADKLARQLVEGKLAACANILGGIQSIYWWGGNVCTDAEVLLILKTTAERLDELTQKVRELHSYELPEVTALPVSGGSSGYLDWVRASVAGAGRG